MDDDYNDIMLDGSPETTDVSTLLLNRLRDSLENRILQIGFDRAVAEYEESHGRDNVFNDNPEGCNQYKACSTTGESSELHDKVAKAKAGDKDAMNDVVAVHEKMLHKIANKYLSQKDPTYDDLMQEGRMAVMRSVKSDSFDPEKGNFSGFARRAAQNAMIEHLRKGSKEKTETTFKDEEGKTGMEPVAPKEHGKTEENPLKGIAKGLAALDERERDVMIHHFGLHGGEPVSQKDLAAKHNVSAPRINQIIKQAAEKMKKVMTENQFRRMVRNSIVAAKRSGNVSARRELRQVFNVFCSGKHQDSPYGRDEMVGVGNSAIIDGVRLELERRSLEVGVGMAIKEYTAKHGPLENVFCPTGPGGGVDPSCSPGSPHPTGVEFLKSLGGHSGLNASQMKDKDGNLWVQKAGYGEEKKDRLQQEVEADQLYNKLGIKSPESSYIEHEGAGYKYSKFLNGEDLNKWEGGKTDAEKQEMYQKIAKGFAADCLFANWDVIGMTKDNIKVDEKGDPWRIDNGGSFRYRASGTPKGDQFGTEVKELETMRSPSKYGASEIFGHLNDSDVAKQIQKLYINKDVLNSVKDEKTRDILKARMEYMKKWADDKEVKSAVADSSASAIAEGTKEFKLKNPLPSPPTFVSSIASNVEANNKVVGELIGLASKGDLEGLKNHPGTPSPKVQGYKASLISHITQEMTTPPAHPSTPAPSPIVAPPAGNPLHTGEGLIQHLIDNGSHKVFTALALAKLHHMNPGGLKYGVMAVPKWLIDAPKQINFLKKVLPVGVSIVQKGDPGAKIAKEKGVKKFAKAHSLEDVGIVSKMGEGGTSTVKGAAGHTGEITSKGETYTLHDNHNPQPTAENKAWVKTLEPAEVTAIGHWKGSAKAIRKSIAAGRPSDTALAFLSGIMKNQPYVGQLHRGVHFKNKLDKEDWVWKQIAAFKAGGVGAEYSENVPCCTSRNGGTSANFAQGGLVYTINAKSARSIENVGNHNGEHEIVTIPGVKYKVSAIRENVTLKTSEGSHKVAMHVVLDEI
jgi:RNA polymerase sigma factor (sigma-70 family)